MSCLHNRDQILEFLRKFFLKGFHIYQNYLCVLEYRLVLIYSFLRFSGRSLEPRTCPTKAKVSLNRNPKGGGCVCVPLWQLGHRSYNPFENLHKGRNQHFYIICNYIFNFHIYLFYNEVILLHTKIHFLPVNH